MTRFEDLDALPRMRDTVRPESLDTDACVNLASEILRGLAVDYACALRRVRYNPANPDAREELARMRRIYMSDYFAALTMGMVDPRAVMSEIERHS